MPTFYMHVDNTADFRRQQNEMLTKARINNVWRIRETEEAWANAARLEEYLTKCVVDPNCRLFVQRFIKFQLEHPITGEQMLAGLLQFWDVFIGHIAVKRLEAQQVKWDAEIASEQLQEMEVTVGPYDGPNQSWTQISACPDGTNVPGRKFRHNLTGHLR